MFELLPRQQPDPLLALIRQFQNDPRPGKIDLGVGTYRDEQGRTPVFQAIKAAERLLAETQQTKSYLGSEGDQTFVDLLRPVVFGPSERHGGERHVGCIVGVQTPGGSGALRLGAELLALARPGTKVWLGTPTWSNHRPVLEAAGLHVSEYRYFDPATQSVCLAEMHRALSQAQAGDVVLLQGCCHNPTGADLDQAQWGELATFAADRELIPFIDLAYQGLGDGLEGDARGMRQVLARAREAMVAYSCDKNFGLYRERTGALFVMGDGKEAATAAYENLQTLARVNWSMPPDHGAAAVRCVLEAEELEQAWRSELGRMAERIRAVRQHLADLDPELGFLTRQKGMFALLPLSRKAVEALRRDHGIFVADSGRMNIAGLRIADVERLVEGLRAVRSASAPKPPLGGHAAAD